ncbi:unnamed protein product [Arabis nemorensis]|uniref:valine--tRNA ligase n=1 Tax=Arabis nemorensis TaxID=586526 RepID=A0A565ALY2_9BRAS|nr:unnamed protein product [Arabis nemorensis]
MDEQRSKAVTEAFVKLHKGLFIYRDLRLVQWDCLLRRALSALEVEHIDIKERTPMKVSGYEKLVEFGFITSFAYPLERGEGQFVVVASTRVETKQCSVIPPLLYIPMTQDTSIFTASLLGIHSMC